MIAGAAVMGMGLAACGKKTEPAKPTAEPTKEAPTKAPTMADDASAATTPPADDAAAASAAPADDAAAASAPAADDAGAASAAMVDDAAAPAADPNVKRYDGFAAPESALLWRGAEPKDDVWIVSQVNGQPLDKDDNGVIAKVGPDGTKIVEKWIDGASPDVELNGPKGSATDGKSLWVADIDNVRKFDLATGKLIKSIPLDGATFLNDVTIDSTGRVLVTDTGMKADAASPVGFSSSGSAAIWTLDAATDEAKVLIKDETIGNPNGIVAGPDGTFVTNGFDASKTLELHGADGKVTGTLDVGFAMLDGLACPMWNKAGDVVCLTSSWDGGRVVEVARMGGTVKATSLFEGLQGPADFAYDERSNTIVLPVMMAGTIEVHTLTKPIGEGFSKDP